MSGDYYNDHDPFAAAWLRTLIVAGLLPEGDVDDRSIIDVRGDDLRGYRRCHFFAGIGGWPYALSLAGWPEDEEVWTGSPPCQPLSVAGQGKGHVDERHLWPAFYRLVAERRPARLFGEQVASADGREWFAGVRADLEASGYAVGAAIVPACSVGAPHRRERIFFVADAQRADGGRGRIYGPSEGADETSSRASKEPVRSGSVFRSIAVADADGGDADAERLQRSGRHGLQPEDRRDRGRAGDIERVEEPVADAANEQLDRTELQSFGRSKPSDGGFWDDARWLVGADGKARRVKPGLRLLAHGLPARVGRLRGYGNAIVPQVAACFVIAFREAAQELHR